MKQLIPAIFIILGLVSCAPKASQVNLDKNRGYNERGTQNFSAFGKKYDDEVRDITFLVFPENEDLGDFQFNLSESQLPSRYPFEQLFSFNLGMEGFHGHMADSAPDLPLISGLIPLRLRNPQVIGEYLTKMWWRVSGDLRTETLKSFLDFAQEKASGDSLSALFNQWDQLPLDKNANVSAYVGNIVSHISKENLGMSEENQRVDWIINFFKGRLSAKGLLLASMTNKVNSSPAEAVAASIGHLGKSRDLAFEVVQATKLEMDSIEAKIGALVGELPCFPVFNNQGRTKSCKSVADVETFDEPVRISRCKDIDYSEDGNLSPEVLADLVEKQKFCSENFDEREKELQSLYKLYNDTIRESTKGVVVEFFEKLKDYSGTKFLSLACTKISKDACIDQKQVDEKAQKIFAASLIKYGCFKIINGDLKRKIGKCSLEIGVDTEELATFPDSCLEMRSFYGNFYRPSSDLKKEFSKNSAVCKTSNRDARPKDVKGDFSRFILSDDGQTVQEFRLRMELLGKRSEVYSLENGGITNLRYYERDKGKQIWNLEFSVESDFARVEVEASMDYRDFYDLRFIGEAIFYFSDGRVRKGIFKMEIDQIK